MSSTTFCSVKIDDQVPVGLLDGRRHAVFIERNGELHSREMARTRWGARRLYSDYVTCVATQPGRADAVPGDVLVILRIEGRRVVDARRLRVPGEPPAESGVREPRRPAPTQGGASAVVGPEDED